MILGFGETRSNTAEYFTMAVSSKLLPLTRGDRRRGWFLAPAQIQSHLPPGFQSMPVLLRRVGCGRTRKVLMNTVGLVLPKGACT